MDDAVGYEEESLLQMQKEMQNLKQRENELARKIAQANRQKSMSKESLGDSKEQGRGKVRSGSPKVSLGADSPTRDYFHGRNIESKVAKYIRGEDIHSRKSNGVNSRSYSSGRSHSASSTTRYGRGIRASSTPDNSSLSRRQDTPREKSRIELESDKHKSTPNLSTIDDMGFEEKENVSDNEGTLRSRSKRTVVIEKSVSVGNLDEIDIPENTLVDTSDADVTTSSVSIEIQKFENMQNPAPRNLIDLDDESQTENKEQAENDTSLSLEDISHEVEKKSSSIMGSTIDIESIVWSGNTTREEDELEVETGEKLVERKISWNPEDIIVGNDSLEKRGSQSSIFRSLKQPPINWTSETSTSDDLTSENLRSDQQNENEDEDDSPEELSARELILDAKSKIELEIEELQKREEELKTMRQQSPARKISEGERSTGEEEFFEANETLAMDAKGLIQKEMEESKQREMEYKNIQILIYGESAIPDKAESESDEDDTDETNTITPSVSFDNYSRGKIEKEMAESMQRESEYQNRFTKVTPSQKSIVKEESVEEEDQFSDEDLEEVKAPVDAVTKIELEIEEIRQREEELKKMRNFKEMDDNVEEEVIHSEIYQTEEASTLDPIRKIEMEIEQDRRRDLELKQRYGINTELEERNEVIENGIEELEQEEEAGRLTPEVETVIKIEEPVQQLKGISPGKVRIPDAFQAIAKKEFKPMNEQSDPVVKSKPNNDNHIFQDVSLKHRTKSAEAIIDTTRMSKVEHKRSEDFSDEKTDEESEVSSKEEDDVTSEEEVKEKIVSSRASAPELRRRDGSESDTVRSGFTKEKIYLFDPHKKPKAPKVKENKITRTKKKFEMTETKPEQQGQRGKTGIRDGELVANQDSNENNAPGSKNKVAANVPRQKVRRLSAEFQELGKKELHSHGGKRYVLRKRSSAKSKRGNTIRPEVRSQVSEWHQSGMEKDHSRQNGDGYRNGGLRHGSAKFKEETDSYQVPVGRLRKRESFPGDPDIEIRKGHVEEQRRNTELMNRERAQAISREQLKKRDARLESERQREKRRSMAELWEKNMVNRDEDVENEELITTNMETSEKFKAQSPRKSEGSKKTSALKASAQRRVQQWEQLIASRGHIYSK